MLSVNWAERCPRKLYLVLKPFIGVSRNVNWGEGLTSFPVLFLPHFVSSPFFLFLLLSFPLEVGSLKFSSGFWESIVSSPDGAWVGTNRIHGKKCMISWQNFLNVSNFTENSRKEFQKFAGNSRAPQTLFRGAALKQTKKFQNNEYLLH